MHSSSTNSLLREQTHKHAQQYAISNITPLNQKVSESSSTNNAIISLHTNRITSHIVDKNDSIINREKRIVKTLKNSDFKFISNNDQLHSFDNKLPRYITSCFTSHVSPTYFCDACTYQTGVKSRFNQHHLTQKHLNNLEVWINNQVKTRTTPNNPHNIKDEMVCEKQPNTQSSDIVLDQLSNIPKALNKNDTKDFQTINDIQIPGKHEVVKKQQNISIQEMLVLKSQEYIISKITELVPTPCRAQIINLLNILGISKDVQTMIITHSSTFKASKHWIAVKYFHLLSKSNLRDYLLDKWSHNDHSFVFKSHLERIEIQTISGAARDLFDILAPSSIPIEYLCMLAVLMTDQKHLFFMTQITLEDNHIINLLLRDGVLTLSKLFTQLTSKKTTSPKVLNHTSQHIAAKFPNTTREKTVIPDSTHRLQNDDEKTRKILIQAEKLRDNSTLCVKGLQRNCTNTCLRRLFLPFGHITKIFKITNTTAIVKFSKRFKAKLAMKELNGSTFEGQSITMTMTNSIQATKIENLNTIHSDIDSKLVEDLTPTVDNNVTSSTVAYECQNIPIDMRLQDFNNNAWEIISMEDITLNPYSQYNIKVKISQDNLEEQFKSLWQHTNFVVTCGLCPYPQVIEGSYKTQDFITNITVRNSSQVLLTFEKGIPIQGLAAHTCIFVSRSITQHNPNHYLKHPENFLCSHNLTQLRPFKK